MSSPSFRRLFHADWSISPKKRWVTEAFKEATGWRVEAPRLVGQTDQFVATLLQEPQPTLAGFDFPIGVPAAFGQKTGFTRFTDAIQTFGTEKWSDFYLVAERPQDVSITRPFYPRVSSSLARQIHLVEGLEVEGMDALFRECERATSSGKAACSLFWTLGGQQVGKAAISGWRDIVKPARAAGALLWPFDGSLAELAGRGRLVVCETYPAEAYGHFGLKFPHNGSKRRQSDRKHAASKVAGRCLSHSIHLSSRLQHMLDDGFGPCSDGEDPFDAVAGLLGMIEVVEGRRHSAPAATKFPEWEGWILGR